MPDLRWSQGHAPTGGAPLVVHGCFPVPVDQYLLAGMDELFVDLSVVQYCGMLRFRLRPHLDPGLELPVHHRQLWSLCCKCTGGHHLGEVRHCCRHECRIQADVPNSRCPLDADDYRFHCSNLDSGSLDLLQVWSESQGAKQIRSIRLKQDVRRMVACSQKRSVVWILFRWKLSVLQIA